MGIETVIAGISAVVGVIGGIAAADASSRAAAAQREANAIESAQQEVRGRDSRRQRIREARIRRAQIIAASENQGTGQSSGQVGAVGALTSNLGGLVGTSLGESAAARGVNNNMQRAADFTSQANTITAWTNTIQTGLGGFKSIFDS